MNKLNSSLSVARVILVCVLGVISLCAFLLAVNLIGSVVTDNTAELPGVIFALAVTVAVGAALFAFESRCAGHAEKRGAQIELTNYFGGTVTLEEEEFIRLSRSPRGVYTVKTKNNGRYFLIAPGKCGEAVGKLFPFAKSNVS